MDDLHVYHARAKWFYYKVMYTITFNVDATIEDVAELVDALG